MELETQCQVSGNQLKRQDEDNKLLADKLDTTQVKVKELTAKLKEQQHKYSDLESKMKDERMTWKIREAEHTQAVAELTQKISRLETKNEEMVAEGELRYNSLEDSDQVRELQDKVADMKAEVSHELLLDRRYLYNNT
ncbi:ecotropic viral integration site 5 ortholog-like isoform X3 [Diaphorina citri]|uniref:Ecotropic viral integration site 5 ortholog-like isoform X3 n=1 Tax=Diaphorina citri TaxID=121845 RepID=A0A3Q0JGG0_DIACI|nr:ecotropic viral integration site 5 ortholog-like isoform X3 [Diaphorina citri]